MKKKNIDHTNRLVKIKVIEVKKDVKNNGENFSPKYRNKYG
jgi:hypothetical protein